VINVLLNAVLVEFPETCVSIHTYCQELANLDNLRQLKLILGSSISHALKYLPFKRDGNFELILNFVYL
jgi:hypothetical protein